ncbi:hypothetical protein ACFOY2_49240 [Nonomuraea purpurea]|uniref:Sensor domain-containing protein n=1 Tax=Nonomuraea purpurea TaxID=1849276 RepID=A0ABV8GQP6_9ACTN
MNRRSAASALLIAILSFNAPTGCESWSDPPSTEQPPQTQPKNPPPAKKGFCPEAGPITRSLLPSPEGVARIATNPCLGVNDFLGLVLDGIPEKEMAGKEELRKFRSGLTTFAKQVVLVADAVDCAYENDHLAVSVYQDPRFGWSLGVVAVVRGDVEALAEDAICLLTKQVPFIPDVGVRAEGPPTPTFCADTVLREAQGYQFRVVWLASSDRMCRSLSGIIKDA